MVTIALQISTSVKCSETSVSMAAVRTSSVCSAVSVTKVTILTFLEETAQVYFFVFIDVSGGTPQVFWQYSPLYPKDMYEIDFT